MLLNVLSWKNPVIAKKCTSTPGGSGSRYAAEIDCPQFGLRPPASAGFSWFRRSSHFLRKARAICFWICAVLAHTRTVRESTLHWPAAMAGFFCPCSGCPAHLGAAKKPTQGWVGNNHQRRRFATDTAAAPVSYPHWDRNHRSSTFRCLDMGFDISTPYL